MLSYIEIQAILHCLSGEKIAYQLLSPEGQNLHNWVQTYRLANAGTPPSMELLMSKLGVEKLPKMDDYSEVTDQVVDKYLERELDRMFEELPKKSEKGNAAALGFIRSEADKLAQAIASTHGVYRLTDYEGRLAQYKADILAQKDRRVCGFGDGWEKLDSITNGVEKKDMIYVYARWGEGKSTFARKWAINFMKQGKRTLLVTLEEDAETVLMMLEAMYAEMTNSQDYVRRNIGPMELKKLGFRLGSMKAHGGEILVCDALPGYKIEGMSDLIVEHRPDVAILDQLTLAAESSEWKDFTQATRYGKRLAMKSEVPQIWLTQASKSGAIGYSDSAGQDADKVIYVTPTPEKAGEYKSIKIFKNRRGVKGDEIPVDFDPGKGLVQELYADRAPTTNWAEVRGRKGNENAGDKGAQGSPSDQAAGGGEGAPS